MKTLNKFSLLLASFVTVTLASASDISDLPNFQIELKHSPDAALVANKQTEKSFTLNKVDTDLGVAPFEWASQNNFNLKEKSTDALSIANAYVQSKYPQLVASNDEQLKASAILSKKRNIAKLRYLSEMRNGVKIAKYTQEIDGLAVHAREFNVLLNANNQIVASSGYLTDKMPQAINQVSSKATFSIDSRAAIEFAFADVMGGPYSISLQDKTPTQAVNKVFSAQQQVSSVSLDENIRVKKVWFDQRSQLIPAYYVELLGSNNENNQQFAYGHVIAANSGNMLSRMNLVSKEAFTYRVFSENRADAKPLAGPQGTEFPIIASTPQEASTNLNRQVANANYINVTLESGPISTGDPWLPANATRTEGNNVFAYLDIDSTNGFSAGDMTAETTSALTFDYAFDANATVNDAVRKTATVNLFYLNNWLHDWFYDSGFDEVSGNAQTNNLGRGGSGGDVLLAEAQDDSGRNNANMSTPSDGGSPRMQMFLWDGDAEQGVSYDLNLTNVAGFANPLTGLSGFGPNEFASLTEDVVAYVDGIAAPSTTDACEAASNAADLVGKIALVDRGDCNFTVKVINAQTAGAVAVLVANNVGGNQVITLGGDDAAVTIPSLMVSQNAGAAIRQSLASGNTVSATMFRNPVGDLDGTFDNVIVAHEWGHYISNRLIANSAGLNNTQGRGMGEGWGDFLSIITFVDEDDASVLGNEQYQGLYPIFGWVANSPYFGIRRVPYTTNFALNSLTFKHIEDGVALPTTHPVGGGPIENSEVHNTGEIWTSALWDIYAGLINDSRYTFTQAQNLMKEYIVAGMKMTPASPTFTEARDAILSVLRASNEQDFQLALDVFAKRGLGTGAVSPDRTSTSNSGVAESFETSLLGFVFTDASLDSSSIGFCSDDNVLDVGESAILKVTILNNGFDPLSNVPVRIASTADVSFQNNGEATIANLAVGQSTELEFGVTLNSATTSEVITFDIEFPDVAGTIEPLAKTLNVLVNYGFANDTARTTEDMQSTILVENDWAFEVNAAQTANVAAAQESISVLETGTLNNTQTLYIEDVGFQADISFVSPELNIGTDVFSFSFDHLFSFEDGSWDGGVIEISDGGGAWQDVTDAGGTFVTGYNGIITTNPASPIDSRNAFVNDSAGALSETVSFGTSFANKSVRIRFRMGADAAAGGYGWEIDNIVFNGLSNTPFSQIVAEPMPCTGNSAPVANVAATSISATEGDTVSLDASSSTDANGDTLSYQWSQVSGPSVNLINATSAVASFTAPAVTQDATLSFTVSVSDGTASSSTNVTVSVAAINQAPVASVASANITVAEGGAVSLDASASNDPDADTLSYSWVQTSGATIALTNANMSTATFTAPQVTADSDFGFAVTVSDGSLESQAQVTVTVTNQTPVTPPVPEPSSGGGGGGSMGYLFLLMFSLIFVRKRREKIL